MSEPIIGLKDGKAGVRPVAGGRWLARNQRLAGGIVSILVLVLIWETIALTQPPFLFPSLVKVFRSLLQFAREGDLIKATTSTVQSVAMGSLLSLIAGSLIGFALARSEAFTSPFINFVQTVPYIVWALLAVIWFGLTQFSVVFTIFVAAFPIVSFNVAAGITNVDPSLLEMAKSVHATRTMVVRHIILPSLTPYLLSAGRTMLGVSWKISVLAELFTGGEGVGHNLLVAWEFSRTIEVFAWTVWLVVLMLLTEWLILRPVELLVTRWKAS